MKQCHYRHCRRFAKAEYCDVLCQVAQESRDIMSAALKMGLVRTALRVVL